jgi:hypothetical protein
VAHRSVGAGRGVSGGEVEDDSGGDYGNASNPDVIAHALLLQEAHDTVRGTETEGAATD